MNNLAIKILETILESKELLNKFNRTDFIIEVHLTKNTQDYLIKNNPAIASTPLDKVTFYGYPVVTDISNYVFMGKKYEI